MSIPNMKLILRRLYHVLAVVYVGVLGLNISAFRFMNACHLVTSRGATGIALTDPRFQELSCVSRLGPVVGGGLHAFVYGYTGIYKVYSAYYVPAMLVAIAFVSWLLMQHASRKLRSLDLYLFCGAALLLVYVGLSAFDRA